MTRQLRASEVQGVRAQLMTKQKYRCPMCDTNLANGTRTALDHCHTTGNIRATLCNTCNQNEGRVLKAMRYMALKSHRAWTDPVGWLRALADYLEHHRDNPSGLIHPTFDIATGKQKPKKRPIKRRTARSAKKVTKVGIK